MTVLRKKIGIMGGTFDPIHLGHLILGERAWEQLGLDSVWFMPSGNPPHKQFREGRATDEQRVRMVQAAISGNPHFSLSLIEMNEEGYTYSYLTLERLRREYPDTDFYFIIGADSLRDFHTWMKPERISRACTLVAAARDQITEEELMLQIRRVRELYGGEVLRLDTPSIDISSHEIRDWAKEGRSLRYFLRDSVIDIIRNEHIYGYTDTCESPAGASKELMTDGKVRSGEDAEKAGQISG